MTDIYNECDFSTDSLDEEQLEELLEQYETLEDLCVVHLSFRFEDKACLWATQEHDTFFESDDFNPYLHVKSPRGELIVEEALVALQERRLDLGLDPTDPTTYPNYRQPREAGAGGLTPQQEARGEDLYFQHYQEVA